MRDSRSRSTKRHARSSDVVALARGSRADHPGPGRSRSANDSCNAGSLRRTTVNSGLSCNSSRPGPSVSLSGRRARRRAALVPDAAHRRAAAGADRRLQHHSRGRAHQRASSAKPAARRPPRARHQRHLARRLPGAAARTDRWRVSQRGPGHDRHESWPQRRQRPSADHRDTDATRTNELSSTASGSARSRAQQCPAYVTMRCPFSFQPRKPPSIDFTFV